MRFEAGALTKQNEAILNILPVDITFMGEDDAVKSFNKAEKRVFARTKAILDGRCSSAIPEKHLHG